MDIVGKITTPTTGYSGLAQGGFVQFLTNILRLIFVVAGIYAFINFILAGFQYMSAAGDSKALSAAWNRIWNSLLGLILVIGSFAIASLLSQIIFGRADFILNPTLYGPGD
jgi:hypothetical protein